MRAERALPHLLSPALLVLLCGFPGPCAAQAIESTFAAAVTDCRRYPRASVSATSIHLNDDGSVLCFDGQITKDLDVSPVNGLGAGGLFVVRSPGGYRGPAMQIATMLESKAATVVIYDYCISACAKFIYASVDTYVVQNSVVAWHKSIYGGSDPGVMKFVEIEAAATQSPVVKKMIWRLNAGGIYPVDRLWIWHPRYYANARRGKITYESYPESQDELDNITSKLGLPQIIHDP
jgi:hypothetical protein